MTTLIKELSTEVLAANTETYEHIHRVRELLNEGIMELLHRGHKHDRSKLASPEAEAFAAQQGKLAGSTYGSQEFNDRKENELSEALAHHYARNSHHPEHFKDGIEEMTLIGLFEMLCDWKASSERHNDGNIRKSIELNRTRFKLSPQLVRILENTADALDS